MCVITPFMEATKPSEEPVIINDIEDYLIVEDIVEEETAMINTTPEPYLEERIQFETTLIRECISRTELPAQFRENPRLEMYDVKFSHAPQFRDAEYIPVTLPEGFKLKQGEDYDCLQLCNENDEVVFDCFVKGYGGCPTWLA